jgi:hypothetical protein
MEQTCSHWTHFYDTWYFLISWNYVEEVSLILREYVFTFMTITAWVLLRMRNVLDKSRRGNENTHVLCSTFFSPWKSYLLLDNVEKYGRTTDDNIIRRMCFTCWISKATHTHRICNTFCFPRQQWFRERPLLLHYTYIKNVPTVPILSNTCEDGWPAPLPAFQ